MSNQRLEFVPSFVQFGGSSTGCSRLIGCIQHFRVGSNFEAACGARRGQSQSGMPA